ncbi:MAG: T9SS type A sorting domain-containing protein [Candidatus Cloacimonetes bacterium]|nr:T9SS type A sorting domain-containing protein [Candidatus Cloacimonadota bacterium]
MRILMFILCIICALNLYSTIINIPADYPTIQDGINAAEINDTVYVAAGIYYENLFWPGVNGIKLIGSGQDDCFINGNSSGSVISFDEINGIIDSTTIITDLTITNGAAYCGGGIYSYYASPGLRDITVTANSASMDGGGLYCFNYSHFVIDNVTISENTAASEGGGINCDFTSSLLIQNCRIINNTANYSGGGICIEGGSSPEISYTLIAGNTAEYGGGIWSGEKGACDLVNCTVTDNSASEQGGGYFSYYPTLDVTNCIFWDNSPDQIYEDASVTYSDIQGNWTGPGNLDSDPLFVDAENGDYHLTINSPCIDAGNPVSPFDPDNTIADMGAFYFDQNTGIENQFLSGTHFSLSNYPNPFNPVTTISFSITDDSQVILAVYNIKGQEVKTLTNELLSKGTHTVIWRGLDNNNNKVSSGIYLYKLNINGITCSIKKCTMLK